MRRVVIVQARMSASRLPGKVLVDLDGRPMLARELERLRRCEHVDEIVIATTDRAVDDPVARLADAEGARVFRGDEQDVLSRYYGAAREARADVVVRITADCPLIEPALVDEALSRFAAGRCDYLSNTRTRTYPRGLDTEVFHADVLSRMHRLATSRPAREHVTWFLHRERPDLFVCVDLVDGEDNSDLRWTVDTEDDLRLVRAVWEAARLSERAAPYRDVLAAVRGRPDLVALNAHVRQKAD